MVSNITRTDVQRLLAEGAIVVDVRPAQEFSDEHIAGAIHIHLKSLDTDTTAVLDRNRPVIVY